MRVTTGTYLCRLLEARGVELVFGIPGVHTIELYRGLVGSPIRHVTPRHEQGAGFMADGYARASGKPGVAFVISGPGVSNIATAMGQAYGDSVPMLVISSVNAQGRMDSGRGWLHELSDQRGMSAHVTAFSRTIRTPEELAPALDAAFALFASARPRPVHLEIPTDVLAMEAGHLAVSVAETPAAGAADGVAEAAARLAAAQRPVILAGGGLRAAPQALAEALDAPVVMTVNARGLMPHDHPLAVPFSPSLAPVRALLTGADAVLALGTELGPTDCDMYEDGGFALPAGLIRVDIDADQIARGPDPALGLVGDAAATLRALEATTAARVPGDGAARAQAARAQAHAGLGRPMQAALGLLDALRSALPEALFVGDSTQLVYAGNLGFAPARPRAWWNSATGFGTLGYGLPAAVGAALGAPGRPVIALVGDGGLQFSLAELASATEAGVPVIALVHDNTGYGEIKSAMRAADVSPIGVDLFTPDLEAIARACGWRVDRPDTPEALVAMVRAAAARPVPGMIHVSDRLIEGFTPER